MLTGDNDVRAFLPDTGAAITSISLAEFQRFCKQKRASGPFLHQTPRSIQGAVPGQLTTQSYAIIVISLQDGQTQEWRPIALQAQIVPGATFDFLLGGTDFKRHQIKLDYSTNRMWLTTKGELWWTPMTLCYKSPPTKDTMDNTGNRNIAHDQTTNTPASSL